MPRNAAARRPIRVLVDGTDWLTDAVRRALQGQPDMQLVDESATRTVRGGRQRPDVVVTSLRDSEVDWKHRMVFFTEAGVPLVAISQDRSRAEVYDRWVIRELGFERLVATIRKVGSHQREH